ncbi:tRNA preQ1(34) S-adenosylmethionine ribosyltransferase-isomerase QueA [Alkaliphilus pronyensis]|uniref:S-adenosylmethionine:tRNA ribosyltransferase-isomerase n=1 Tax=Alkaliphilus pronyensis TaxID=1482732 RepID=A0A6I0FDX0_9FIRM|nr:tRNA preQ1(34) S-adenosylmethionine ribosyltransferase-isomerase QueA [Alkaliphilus pronyensis]KAB3537269.1 tRNA preQ1(34) S-adenosylmethionine ribosyltransferase-isomerase QueA [Alkaliphilus pronyensis]
MKTTDFNYYLPEELIAQTPLEKRDESRLMVLNKETGEISHRHFYNIIDYINEGDCLVLNDTRVIPARLIGEKTDTGGKIEFLLLKQIELDKWEVLVKPGKRAKIGTWFEFGNGILKAKIEAMGEDGSRIVTFSYEGVFEEILDKLGNMPLPPYITETLEDNERYQTVYSKNKGSAAAPTAGLHLTEELLQKIKAKGANIVFITLHVGLGTFRPVKVENVKEHKMHEEYYSIEAEAAETINLARKMGKKVIAVGTTCCRTLESATTNDSQLKAGNGWTDIFIYPGYQFKIVDNLITNFHLPESTLIMMVSALASKEIIMKAYETAVKEGYRFFSFGDAMFIKGKE